MPPLASYCDLPTAGNCNLRSAWLACSDQQDPCEILLPQDAYVSMNSAYGSLILLNGMEVIIHGQNATVFPILQSLQFITYFSSGSGDSPTLQLNQLNIMNFGTPYGSGGSISINNDCSLTLDNVSFLNSHANEGGAIYITDNSKPSRISNSFFYNCSSLIDGGAIEIYRVSALTIEDSTFENCLAQEVRIFLNLAS